MGACAVCLQPITKTMKFRLVGTESIHDACVSRAGESVVWRMKGEIQRLADDLRTARALLADRSRELHHVKNDEVPALRRDRDHARDEAERAKVDQRRRFTAEAERDTALSMRDSARAERDSARAELALHRTLGPEPIAARELAPAEKDDRNPMEIRFSLLDLDEP